MLFYISIILVGISVYIVTKLLLDDESQFKGQEKLDEGSKKGIQTKKIGIILRFARPFFKRYFSPLVASLKQKKVLREKYRRPIASAGIADLLTPEDFLAFKLSLIIGFPIIYVVLKFATDSDWPLYYLPLMAIFGYFYPDLWIKGMIKKRQEEIINNMPFSVDLLALSVEAGLDFTAAMTKVVQKAKSSALTEEFSYLLKEIKIGSSRAQALRQMAWRVNMIPISSFCAGLIAADQVGASLAPILKGLSQEVRQKRSTQLEKKGAEAATKILLPMMMFIMPALFIVIASPFIVEFL